MTGAACWAGNAHFPKYLLSLPAGSSWFNLFMVYIHTECLWTIFYGLMTGLIAWMSLTFLCRTYCIAIVRYIVELHWLRMLFGSSSGNVPFPVIHINNGTRIVSPVWRCINFVHEVVVMDKTCLSRWSPHTMVREMSGRWRCHYNAVAVVTRVCYW